MKIHCSVREICELTETVRNTTKQKNQQRDKSAIWQKEREGVERCRLAQLMI
jgi:hypothetical protein